MAESQRVKLEITEVKERQPFGDRGASKLNFKAKVGEEEHWFTTFSNRLFETVEKGKGKTFEADVVTTESEYGTQRKVTQIYVDGQPVGGQKQWQARQDSPEKIASIENQKRADIIAQLWMADKLKDSSSQVKKLLKWLDELGASPNPAPKPDIKQAEKDARDLWPDTGTEGEGRSAEKVLPSEIPDDPVDQTEKQVEPDPLMNNLGDFFKACYNRYGMAQAQVLKELGGISKGDIGDLADAWAKIKAVREEP